MAMVGTDRQGIGQRVRDARRSRAWSQTELAGRASVSQSAISLFEQGRPDVLAGDKIAEICRLLAVEYTPGQAAVRAVSGKLGGKYCPVPECPSNVPYHVGGATHYRPCLVRAPLGSTTFCGECGEILLAACGECGAPCCDGAFCPSCGTPRVVGPELDAAEVMERLACRERVLALTSGAGEPVHSARFSRFSGQVGREERSTTTDEEEGEGGT
jgi:DNA-binding Xre family transcriptional regulator